jgi:hypothetical protein
VSGCCGATRHNQGNAQAGSRRADRAANTYCLLVLRGADTNVERQPRGCARIRTSDRSNSVLSALRSGPHRRNNAILPGSRAGCWPTKPLAQRYTVGAFRLHRAVCGTLLLLQNNTGTDLGALLWQTGRQPDGWCGRQYIVVQIQIALWMTQARVRRFNAGSALGCDRSRRTRTRSLPFPSCLLQCHG